MAADPRNAELALSSGAAVLVYPGGDYEVFRPSWESGKVDFGGRKGFIRLALKMDVPIQPIVSIGSQETALFLSRGERLAKLARLDKLLRLKTAPIMFALPFGLMPGVFGHIPLPAKITIQVLPKIDLQRALRRGSRHRGGLRRCDRADAGRARLALRRATAAR